MQFETYTDFKGKKKTKVSLRHASRACCVIARRDYEYAIIKVHTK